MLQKYFDWTPRDLAYWEKLRQKGLRRFITWYGLVITGGIFFVLFGLVTVIFWFRQMASRAITPTALVFLFGELIVVALVSLLAGVVNSLITWAVEERLYQKWKQRIP